MDFIRCKQSFSLIDEASNKVVLEIEEDSLWQFNGAVMAGEKLEIALVRVPEWHEEEGICFFCSPNLYEMLFEREL